MVQNYLHEVAISTLAWPAKSPVLNPIEHLRDNMGHSVRKSPPRNLNELSLKLPDMGSNGLGCNHKFDFKYA